MRKLQTNLFKDPLNCWYQDKKVLESLFSLSNFLGAGILNSWIVT